ncbi:MAG: aldo/keto reductase [Myxococcales bacterium]|nr:aldo/keto reductase [Myxococcales bacterium]
MRRLPGTDLDLSTVGFGCWAIGGQYWGDDVDDQRSVDAIHAALDHGINWFDTAPLYGYGHADEVLAGALRGRKAIIATKVGVRWDGPDAHAESHLSAARVVADVEASLVRLRRETIDLLQVHWPCQRHTPLEETLTALQGLKRAGKVRWIGLCNYNAAGLRAASDIEEIHCLQTPYNLLRREFEGDLRAATEVAGPAGGSLGVLAYEPLCRGLLTGKFRATSRFPASDLRARDDRFQGPRYLRALTIVSRMALVARRLNVPVSALAIAWLLRQPAVTAAIAGAKSPAQVQENAQAMALAQRDDVPWVDIDRIVSAYRG